MIMVRDELESHDRDFYLKKNSKDVLVNFSNVEKKIITLKCFLFRSSFAFTEELSEISNNR